MAQVSKSPSDPFLLLARLDEKRHGESATAEPQEASALAEIHAELDKGDAGRSLNSLSRRRWSMSLALFMGLILTSLGALKQAPTTLIITGAALSVGLSAFFASGFMPRAGRVSSSPLRRTCLILATIGTLIGLALAARGFSNLSEHLVTRLSMSCFLHVLLTGSIAAGISAFIWRRSDPFTPRLTGALLGAFGGLLGVLSVGLTCPSSEGWHLLFGHGLSVCVLAALGALFGRRILSP